MNKENVKLAIAPIGWTNDDMPELGSENTFQQIVSEMALAGFTGSEVGSKYPRDPAVLKPMLDIRGVQIVNAWFSTFFANGDKAKTIDEFINHRDFLHAMGARVIGCSEQSLSIQGTTKAVLEEKPLFSDEQWRLTAEGYNELAKLAAEKGMTVGLHHHMGTGIQTTAEIDRFMAATNDDVYLLFDTGHAYYSEGSQQAMLDILTKYLPRINHVHLKDVRDEVVAQVKSQKLSFLDGVKKGTFTVPGDGVIDFKPVFKILDDFGYKGWMVVEAEQDPALANPFEYAVKARKYIRENTGL
ncbi:myo-inosose-2 dehydratase [Erwinia aphidicola]|uniref:Inosose dehydratase n=1 Tax=Erwinia aphidicola TaxID=68334 RepID=A0ABU8DCY2_ERWAP|nr:myo-inosose-2 dehydratase [Erwinia aphidicola]KMV68360.1 inosose dehydratase [bacteria symbiont BFo1 of Frankliniella occidentalis]PIJ55387.1 myo-inosose-2 dehydratase [Erwinia sp. OLMDLW33]KYP83203.1 inosose dehydratase [bacteria symbiont BFo1 of Frankliniella occidentalis]KYP87923.1 inosose dehydratase [bacteria symbiont BFo1 of Frankliniella occidentalis]MBD1377786.1 myo-inosose-2 dehydratase [Erwinia aphidicola]